MTATDNRSPDSAAPPAKGLSGRQYTLRGLFIAVTAAALLLGWHGQLVTQRRDAAQNLRLEDLRVTISGDMQ